MKQKILLVTLVIINVFMLGFSTNLHNELLPQDESVQQERVEEVEVLEAPEVISEGTVVLDAGHGGMDGGSVGNGYIEKDITLAITKKIGEYLKEHNIEVIYTREEDVLFSEDNQEDLWARVNISNTSECDAFVSIHLNSSEIVEARGFEIWSSFSDERSYTLAQNVHNALNGLGYTYERELRDQDETLLYVLNHNSAPSILVELGFITSYEDMTYLGNEAYQEQLASTLADTIAADIKA